MTTQLTLGQDPAAQQTERRIVAALRSDLLAEPEKEVLRFIAERRGAEQPITIAELLRSLGPAWPMWDQKHQREETLPLAQRQRLVKRIVKDLIELHGIPIGGSREKPYGYFLVVTAADLAIALRPLKNELRSISKRVQALTSKKFVAELHRQMAIEFDAEQPGRSAA
jgi:hypothetical protein